MVLQVLLHDPADRTPVAAGTAGSFAVPNNPATTHSKLRTELGFVVFLRDIMLTETRTTDAKGRVALPKGFAGATVVIERISDTELRVRKAQVIPEDELTFSEEVRKPLSARDRETVVQLLDHPPKPSTTLKQAMKRYRKRHVAD